MSDPTEGAGPARAAAERIAAALFSDGSKRPIARLVAEYADDDGPYDGSERGGWAQGPLADRVEEILREHFEKDKS